MTKEQIALRVTAGELDAFAAGLADIEMALKYRLHILEHGIKIAAIDRRIVVAVGLREAMREITAATGVHEFA